MAQHDFNKESLDLHRKHKGKIEINGAGAATPKMKIAAAYAIADCVMQPNKEYIIPKSLNKEIATKVAEAVKKAYKDYQ